MLVRAVVLRGLLCGMVTSLSMNTTTNNNGVRDLAVVGCGVLGTKLCSQYLMMDPNDVDKDEKNQRIVGITKTDSHHEEILKNVMIHPDEFVEGRFEVRTLDDSLKNDLLFKNVVFCAPPSGSDDYASTVRTAMKLWAKDEGGVFVLTTSGAVYSSADGSVVNEDSPTFAPEESPRAGRLLYAEEACRENDGTILRLAGLYTLDRGAHNFFMGKAEILRRPDGILNSLHYDDAAGACLAAVKAGKRVRGQTFLISDGSPSTRLGVCESCLKSKMYSEKTLPNFITEESDVEIGKIYDGEKSNKALNWHPQYPSFDAFMRSQS